MHALLLIWNRKARTVDDMERKGSHYCERGTQRLAPLSIRNAKACTVMDCLDEDFVTSFLVQI